MCMFAALCPDLDARLLGTFLQRLWVLHLQALDHPAEVPQVEDVVALGRGGQQLLHDCAVDLHRGAHHGIPGVRSKRDFKGGFQVGVSREVLQT